MRSLNDITIQWLLDAEAENRFSVLPLPLIEKDIHLTDLLAKLSTLEVRHGHFKGLKSGQTAVDDGIKLVFCGGTSLSKAHGVIERMSEDVDLKVVLTEPDASVDILTGHYRLPKMLAKGLGPTPRLKALHQALTRIMAEMEFEVPEVMHERPNPHVRDKHRYWAGRLLFDNRLGQHDALNPELKLELIHRHPRLPTVTTSFGYLHERVAHMPSPLSPVVAMQGIDLAETVAEKVVSLLRRSHWNWFGSQEQPLDPTLVRHVYDVHQILKKDPQISKRASTIFQSLVDGDRAEFKDRDPAFEIDPAGTMLKTLEAGRNHPDWKEKYETRLIPLIYASKIPTFDEALDSFATIATRLIETLEPPNHPVVALKNKGM